MSMDDPITPPPTPAPAPVDSLRDRRHWVRLIGLTVVLGLAVGGVLVAWQLTGMLPRPVRRQMTEGMLRAVLIGYAVLLIAAPAGALVFTTRVVRGRRRGRSHPRLAKLALLCGSGLFALVLVEGASAGWAAWRHRMPDLPTRFGMTSPGEPIRIVVIGGSSALGEPYRPWVSIGQVLAWRLQEAMPESRFEVTILAQLGACLRDMHLALANLKERPDLLVIYSGHNEFVARYEPERDIALYERPRSAALDLLYQLSLNSPFCRLVYDVVSHNRLDGAPTPVSRHQLIDPPQCSPSESAEVLADFKRRLEAIVSWCDAIGCAPLLVVPPSNEADLEPNRSVLPPSVDPAARREFAARFAEARGVDRTRYSAAIPLYRAILEAQPDFAEAHFRLGRLLERSDVDEANRHYIAARDDDGLNTRCTSTFQDVYRSTAARHPAALLIDGPAVLRAVAPNHTVGDELIQDMHHPNLVGTAFLADAALRALHDRGVFGWKGEPPTPVDPADCAAHFGLDAARWATVCERTRVHYERIARYRHDPTERLLRAAAYGHAARLIAEGRPPEQAGVVGLGVSLSSGFRGGR